MPPRSVIALGLLGTYLLVAFGWRILAHHRVTGAFGVHGPSGRPGSPEWLGGVLFVVGLALAVMAPLAARAGWGDVFLSSPALGVAGLLLYGGGVAGTVWSQSTMGASWRIGVDRGERTALVVGGPFRLVRNPIFSFMILAAAGLALYLPTALAIAAVVALAVAVELQVRFAEEPHLVVVHGEEYERYRRRVGRFVPGIGRARSR